MGNSRSLEMEPLDRSYMSMTYCLLLIQTRT